MSNDIRFFCNCSEGKEKLEYSKARCADFTTYFEVDDEICEHCGYYTVAKCDVPKKNFNDDEEIEYDISLEGELYESFINDYFDDSDDD